VIDDVVRQDLVERLQIAPRERLVSVSEEFLVRMHRDGPEPDGPTVG
jgi:hypothetical protein